MPLYDYRCSGCGAAFELLVRSSGIPACPFCGGMTLEKLVSAPAPQHQAKDKVVRARARAAREGHFSNYPPSERPRR